MNRYFNEKSNYDKYPVVNVPGLESYFRSSGERPVADRKESKGRGAGMLPGSIG